MMMLYRLIKKIKNDIRNKLRIKTTDLVIITGGKIDRLKTHIN